MLALRTRFRGGEGFDHLLRRVREVTLGAYEHQVYPFDELVAELGLRRDTSRSALFDTVVILHNNKKLSEAIGHLGFDMKPCEFEQAASKFDITFNFAEVDDTIEYAIEFNTDIYSAEQIRQMADHLQHLLESVSADSTVPLCELSYMDAAEQDKLLVTFNDTECAFDREHTLLDRFAQQVRKMPEATAILFRNTTLSYQQLGDQSHRLAAHLLQQGVQKGDLVGVYMERSEQLTVALLAILKAGAAYVPLDPAYPKDRIAFVISDAGIKTILTQAKLTYRLPAFGGNVILADRKLSETATSLNTDVQSTDVAYVIYTSGSTGQPKGVQVTHGNVASFLVGMDREINHKEGDTLLAITTISFDISVLELFWTLANGMRVVIRPTQYLPGLSSAASSKKMDFSLFYFASEVADQNKYQLLIEGAKYADQHGFSAVWTPERHFHEFGGIYPNPAVTGAAIATITENIHIRSGSCVLPLHNPIRVAEGMVGGR